MFLGKSDNLPIKPKLTAFKMSDKITFYFALMLTLFQRSKRNLHLKT